MFFISRIPLIIAFIFASISHGQEAAPATPSTPPAEAPPPAEQPASAGTPEEKKGPDLPLPPTLNLNYFNSTPYNFVIYASVSANVPNIAAIVQHTLSANSLGTFATLTAPDGASFKLTESRMVFFAGSHHHPITCKVITPSVQEDTAPPEEKPPVEQEVKEPSAKPPEEAVTPESEAKPAEAEPTEEAKDAPKESSEPTKEEGGDKPKEGAKEESSDASEVAPRSHHMRSREPLAKNTIDVYLYLPKNQKNQTLPLCAIYYDTVPRSQ